MRGLKSSLDVRVRAAIESRCCLHDLKSVRGAAAKQTGLQRKTQNHSRLTLQTDLLSTTERVDTNVTVKNGAKKLRKELAPAAWIGG